MEQQTGRAAPLGSGRAFHAAGADARPPERTRQACGDRRLAEIVGYIDRHLCDPDLDVAMLQAAFHLSRPTLYRMFQPLGGVSHHIRERRVLTAHQHLRRDPDCGITWLLYEAGFTSERQFQRAFRATFGLSPAKWRDRCRAENQPRWRHRRRALSLQPCPVASDPCRPAVPGA